MNKFILQGCSNLFKEVQNKTQQRCALAITVIYVLSQKKKGVPKNVHR